MWKRRQVDARWRTSEREVQDWRTCNTSSVARSSKGMIGNAMALVDFEGYYFFIFYNFCFLLGLFSIPRTGFPF